MKGYGKQLLVLYNTEDRDWMSFKICRKNPLTFHHIEKRENGGKSNASNGALLTKKAHALLHCIEYHNVELYNEINNYFKIIIKHRELAPEIMVLIKELIINYIENENDLPKNLTDNKIKRLIA